MIVNQEIFKSDYWKFSKISNIEESNFNKTLERFLGMGINGLVRENIQNSLDGSLFDSDDPVIVKIKTGMISVHEIPGIGEINARIKTLDGRNQYTREAIEHMKSKLNQTKVYYISFEDSNTRGLTGAIKGQKGTKEDTWGIYAYKKGDHYEEEDSQRETARGGSHGIGKIASNAASDLNVMYFANCDENDDQHLGGTVQLIEHVYEEQAYRSTGYFTDVEYSNGNSTFYPYANTFGEVFKKETRGLKIIIPFLRDEYANEKEIIKSVCDSFFVAILNGALKVHVNDEIIAKETIVDYVQSSEYYNQEITEAKREFTPLYLHSYLNQEPKDIVVNNKVEEFYFKLYFTYDERIPTGRVGIFRTIGMKIENRKIKSYIRKPFNAVLIGGSKEDAYIKSLENESHTKLSKDNFNDPRLQRQATRFINSLGQEVARIVEEAINEHNPTDEKIDTSDILYVIENQFKKDLESSVGTVRINKGQTIVKSPKNDSKKEKRSPRENKGVRKHSPKDPKRQRRSPLKWQKSKDGSSREDEQGKESYRAHPDMVERVMLTNKEFIKFDLSTSEDIKDVDNCDVSLAIIDGMGKEYDDEFKVSDSYKNVLDMNTGESCTFKNNTIHDVRIEEGVIQLELSVNESFNPALKFVYNVEV